MIAALASAPIKNPMRVCQRAADQHNLPFDNLEAGWAGLVVGQPRSKPVHTDVFGRVARNRVYDVGDGFVIEPVSSERFEFCHRRSVDGAAAGHRCDQDGRNG